MKLISIPMQEFERLKGVEENFEYLKDAAEKMAEAASLITKRWKIADLGSGDEKKLKALDDALSAWDKAKQGGI